MGPFSMRRAVDPLLVDEKQREDFIADTAQLAARSHGGNPASGSGINERSAQAGACPF